jgi:hypothetical protein
MAKKLFEDEEEENIPPSPKVMAVKGWRKSPSPFPPFVKIPERWLERLASARRASTLKLALFILYRIWKENEIIVISNVKIKPWGLNEDTKLTALAELEKLGGKRASAKGCLVAEICPINRPLRLRGNPLYCAVDPPQFATVEIHPPGPVLPSGGLCVGPWPASNLFGKAAAMNKVRKVVPIAEARFRLLSNTPTRTGWEVFWFATLDETRIGAVVFDPYDKDWGFVALRRDGRGPTGCTLFETVVSIESEKEAREACAAALAGRGRDKMKEARRLLAKHYEIVADVAASKDAYYSRFPRKPWPRS